MTNAMAGIAGLAELIRRETGMVLPAARNAAILAAVDRAAPGLGPGAFVSAASDPGGGRVLVDRLIDQVTVQETTFVRDQDQLDAIPWHSLLQVARAAGSGTIRVWSAGCASGEEAYTLALLAAEAFAPAAPPVEVLGTDISGAALAAAVTGRYRERAVRALRPALRLRYLDRQADGSYIVGERLRRLVRFRRHNLVGGPMPPPGEVGFDLIACRNVLIYFEAALVEPVISSLERSLRPDGVLILGAAEALQRTADRPAAADPPPVRSRASVRDLRRPLGREPPLSRERGEPSLSPERGEPSRSREQRMTAALDAADRGDRDGARAHVAALLAENAADPEGHFIDGLVALEAGRPARACAALRRALCADATFALAAFFLGRAFDALGDRQAARRCYEQTLRTLDPADRRYEQILQQTDIGDIASACRARLGGRP
ncbi:MAG: CheR family methyltransferase [Trebonia sp.]